MGIDNKKEDQIIGEAFTLIRSGIVEASWQDICNAYEMISGEKLDPPNLITKSRLDSIREQIKGKSSSNISKDKVKKTRKPRAKKATPSEQTILVKEVNKNPSTEPSDRLDPSAIDDILGQPGNYYRPPERIVISVPIDETELQENKKKAKPHKPARKRQSAIAGISKEGGDVNFNPNPRR